VIQVVGGCYHEICLSPPIRQFYGSGGRAAAALAGADSNVLLHTYASPGAHRHLKRLAALSDFKIESYPAVDEVSFAYVNPLIGPQIDPPIGAISQSRPIEVVGSLVLMFGMVEGTARVEADIAIYDPQNGAHPVYFRDTGSKAKRLAVVCNAVEARRLTRASDNEAPKIIMREENADVVVVKRGPNGARVVTRELDITVPAYGSESVFGIGSGDVFAAAFTYAWGMRSMTPEASADWASRAVAHYAGTRSERFPTDEDRRMMKPVQVKPGQVYIAAPFFNMPQRWLVEQTRTVLINMGLEVFSPLHHVGFGSPIDVTQGDLAGIEDSDRLFAIVDGLDAGTLLEIGYARKAGTPVYAYTELIGAEDCKLIVGSGCMVFRDYPTALHATAWKL
jgi:Nucleoside 2-deoxyribosyltransferase/pfkB family carbohydrate kinase